MNTAKKIVREFSINQLEGHEFEVEMPRGATILSVKNWKGSPFMWVLTDPAAQVESRWFRWFVAESKEIPPGACYHGSVMSIENGLMFHLFELVRATAEASPSDEPPTSYRVVRRWRGGDYVAGEETYDDLPSAQASVERSVHSGSRFAGVFPSSEVARALEALNRKVVPFFMEETFDKIVEAAATIADPAGFASKVRELLRACGKDFTP